MEVLGFYHKGKLQGDNNLLDYFYLSGLIFFHESVTPGIKLTVILDKVGKA